MEFEGKDYTQVKVTYDVSGIKLASGHRTMKMIDGKITNQMRYTEVTNVKFLLI